MVISKLAVTGVMGTCIDVELHSGLVSVTKASVCSQHWSILFTWPCERLQTRHE